MNKLLLTFLLLSMGCSSNQKVQTVDDVYNKYGTKAVYETPFSKENLENQKKYQEETERIALEQEKLRKAEEAKAIEEQKNREKELLRHQKELPKQRELAKPKPTIQEPSQANEIEAETNNIPQTTPTEKAKPAIKDEDDLDFSKEI